MDKLTFGITFFRKRYNVHVSRHMHTFKNRHQANQFIKKFKDVIHDSVLIMFNLYKQLNDLRFLYSPFYDFHTKRDFMLLVHDFEKAYFMIYHNGSKENQGAIQWQKISYCFNSLCEMINILKKEAQRQKRKEMVIQIYLIEKIYWLILNQYRKELKGLTDGFSYRTKEIRLKPFNDEPIENDTIKIKRA